MSGPTRLPERANTLHRPANIFSETNIWHLRRGLTIGRDVTRMRRSGCGIWCNMRLYYGGIGVYEVGGSPNLVPTFRGIGRAGGLHVGGRRDCHLVSCALSFLCGHEPPLTLVFVRGDAEGAHCNVLAFFLSGAFHPGHDAARTSATENGIFCRMQSCDRI